jgi:hypothetical protein
MKTATAPAEVERLEDVPNIGRKIGANLRQLGFERPDDLRGQDPYEMYDRLCAMTGRREDPCLLDTFTSAVRFMDGGPPLPWWAFTTERKRVMAGRTSR